VVKIFTASFLSCEAGVLRRIEAFLGELEMYLLDKKTFFTFTG